MMTTMSPQPSKVSEDAGDCKLEDSAPAQVVTRHREFYLSDQMTVFRVEDCLFRVHRHFLAENSPLFSSMFSLPSCAPADGNSPVEGSDDENPIFLAGVTELEFESLLRYFYKSMDDGFSMPRKSWIALLSIGHRYEFTNVYERAIRELYNTSKKEEEQDDSLLVSLWEKYDVPLYHVLPWLVELVTRVKPLQEYEVARLSALTVSRLGMAREMYLRKASRPSGNPLITMQEILQRRYNLGKEVLCKVWQTGNDESQSEKKGGTASES